MPRTGHLKSSGERLSDRVSVGVLTSALPQSFVDEELVETGRVQQRNRLLPVRLVAYFVFRASSRSMVDAAVSDNSHMKPRGT
ncbi:transposase domain-containing protein [Streptomyces sp. NBC_01707]|uniref:transposase domain-containing protein n=1 Tax=Streptomyces sp. NBC_01707 TaxID=2975914 RepID=UPI00352C5951